MTRKNVFSILFIIISSSVFSQLPTPSIVGYWESWNGSNFVNLKDIDSRYNVIHIAFASLKSGKDYELSYTPPATYSEAVFKSEVAALQAEGKKVIISIGGQNDHVTLDSIAEKDAFVASMNAIVDYWGFDGIDIDLEGSSLNFDSINVQNPGDDKQVLMITAIKEIMANHWTTHGKKLILTMAPETIYVQGALSQWAGPYRGAYLPIIEELRDSIDMLNVQLYNSGSMFGLDGQSGGEFKQGNADFVVAMTEAVILGYTGTGTIGDYSGLDASKVGVALPGCHSSDAVPHKELEEAMNYLMGKGPQPGSYTLKTVGGFPNLKGMMTWSINSDRKCDPSYGFVDTWSKLFTDSSYIEIANNGDIYETLENGKSLQVNLFNDTYASTLDTSKWTVSNLPSGVTVDSIIRVNDTTAHLVLEGNANSSYNAAIWNVAISADSSQFVKSTLDLARNNGIILKKTRTKIPGRLQCEDLFAKKSAYLAALFNGEDGYMLRFNEGYIAEFEIDVAKSAEYDITYRVAATNNGTMRTSIKVGGSVKGYQSISSATGWNKWDTLSYKVSLDSGFHVLKLTAAKGWFNIDYIDFSEAQPEGITDANNDNYIVVFPNPSNGIFYSSHALTNAKLMSFDGKILKRWSSTKSFDTEGISPGTYLLIADNYHTKIVIR